MDIDDDVKHAVDEHAFTIAYSAFGQGQFTGVGRERDELTKRLKEELPAVVQRLKDDVAWEIKPAEHALPELRKLASRMTPVAGAEVAAAHTERGDQREELQQIWKVCGIWVRAGRPVGRHNSEYGGLVSLLTRYVMTIEREMGLRK